MLTHNVKDLKLSKKTRQYRITRPFIVFFSFLFLISPEWCRIKIKENRREWKAVLTDLRSDIMRAMMLTGLREMVMREIPDPVLKSGSDVLVKMESIGICGSDVHYYLHGKIGKQVIKYPFRVGHEGSGTVIETGAEVTRIKPGDRVAIDPAMPCWTCDQCISGRVHTCRNLLFLGCPDQAEGCLSDYIVMPERSCYPVPASVSMDQAALSEPLSIGLYAAGRSMPLDGTSIGILGSGPIGISVLLWIRHMGAKNSYITDKIDRRLEKASEMGASWTGNPLTIDIVRDIIDREPQMLDVVFECCGEQDAINQAIEILKPGGKLVIIGIPVFEKWNFPVEELRHKEITIQNIRRQVDCVDKTLAAISEGIIYPDPMITHHFAFSQTAEAFDLVAEYGDGVMKAMIHF